MDIRFDEAADDRSVGDAQTWRRLAVGVGAVMLVAAAAGAGYGVGHSVAESAASRDDGAATEGPATDRDGLPPISSMPDESADVPASTAPTMTEFVEGDAASFAASGGVGWSVFGSAPLTPVAERVTGSGFTLRVQRGEPWEHGIEDWGVAGWQPAPWCYESGQLRVSMSGNGVTDVGSVGWYAEPYLGRAVSSVLLGGADGQPHWIVVVQTPPDATEVVVEFANGDVDRAVAADGFAVLLGPGEPPTPVTEGASTYWIEPVADFQVTITGAPEPVVIGSDGLGTWRDDDFRSACQPPPPALPEPGQQPADAAGAEREIGATMSALYGGGELGEAAALFLDDDTGVEEAAAEVAEGGFAEAAASASVVIEELVFTAPTEAWFRYRIEASSGTFDNRYGIAVVVDGSWRITRATVCQDLGLAGGTCEPGFEAIQPPGVGWVTDADRPDPVMTAPPPLTSQPD